MNIQKNIVLALGLSITASFLVSQTATASDTLAPEQSKQIRETTADISSYNQVITITRNRTDGQEFASFFADPQLLDTNSVLRLEVKSVSSYGAVTRWQCTAVHDVAECLGKPLKIRYLEEDTKIELSFRLQPKLKKEIRQAYAQR